MLRWTRQSTFEGGYERISFFAERFLDVSEAGDFMDQANKRILSARERRLSAGIQRSLRWLGVASNEESMGDQFIAAWISLESILDTLRISGRLWRRQRACSYCAQRGHFGT